jgi:4-carboxymuconolactone decarboxylase
MKARIPLPSPETLSPEGRQIYDAIRATRGNVDGPFLAWLHSPDLAQHAQALGAFCRFGTSLSARESELLILVVANHLECRAEWMIHAPIAAAAGVPAEVIDAIADGRLAGDLSDREHALAECARSLLASNSIPEAILDHAVKTVGLTGVVEAVGLIGYYALVAMTLNAFEMIPDASD